jgi:hypothetical protein
MNEVHFCGPGATMEDFRIEGRKTKIGEAKIFLASPQV